MIDFGALFILCLFLFCLAVYRLESRRKRRDYKPAEKRDKKAPLVEDAGHGWVWVTRGKKRELMTIETAEAAGYIKKKEKGRDELRSAFGVHLGKG